jgi:hypothetical protein
VQFTPPQKWQGSFNLALQAPPMFVSSTWTGDVVYTLKNTNLMQHFAEYSLTSAPGTFFNDWSIGGVSCHTVWQQSQHNGSLKWYFAESGDVPIDSYEGAAYHSFTGISTYTAPDGDTSEGAAVAGMDGIMWPNGAYGETARPLATFENSSGIDEIGLMSESRTRYPSDMPGSTFTVTWDLTSSDGITADIAGRSGLFNWAFTPATKGNYRIRATITRDRTQQHPTGTVWVRSAWASFTVR